MKNKKSALYVRVSTHWQIDKDSLPLQREDLINYSKFVLGINDYKIFEDAGFSGKNTDRPAFQEMMSELRTGKYSHLVVWKIDRISRNLLDFAEMYSELKKLGITFVSKNEQFDTSNAIGEAMLKIILVFAELERNMTSERVTAVMVSRAAGGQWNGGQIPFGYSYDKDKGTFTIEPNEARIVQMIFEDYNQCESLVEVARKLNNLNIKTRHGKEWTPTTVDIILKNPFYVGDYRYNYHAEGKANGNTSNLFLKDSKEWILLKSHHEPIVPRETQAEAIYKLNQNRTYNKKEYQRTHTHIFSGLIFCGCCGSVMVASVDRVHSNGTRPSIYICSKRRRFSDCKNKYITDLTVAPFVFNLILNILKVQQNFGKSTSIEMLEKKLLRGEVFQNVKGLDPNGLGMLYSILKSNREGKEYKSAFTAKQQKVSSELSTLQAEKKKTERAIERLKSLYLFSEESMSEQEYVTQMTKLSNGLKDINSKIKKCESNGMAVSDDDFMSQASFFILTNHLQKLRYINFDSLSKRIEPEILKEFVKSVLQKIVVSDGQITDITFKNGISLQFLY